jgi:hypothetical protein
LEEYLRQQFNNLHYYVSVTDIRFSLFEPAVEGSAFNPNGMHGAITFSAIFSKGMHSVQVSFIHGRILATPYVDTANEFASQAALKAVSDYGRLLVSGLSAGEYLSVYTTSGALVYKVRANASEVWLDVRPGIYIVNSGKRTVKVPVR